MALARAAQHAWQFRGLTGTSMVALLREGLAMKKSQELTFGQMAMAANAPMLTRASMVEGRPEVGILPTGQVVGVIDELPSVAELVVAHRARGRGDARPAGSVREARGRSMTRRPREPPGPLRDAARRSAVVTMNRPQYRNAQNAKMTYALDAPSSARRATTP